MPMEGGIHLELAQQAIIKILDNRLVQRQHGVLRRTVNARILVEFIQQVKSYNTEWFKRKSIKDSMFKWRISIRSEKQFEQELFDLRQKVELFAEELAAAVFMVYNKLLGRWEFAGRAAAESVNDGSTSEVLTGASEATSSSDSSTSDIFEAAFQSTVEVALKGEVPKRESDEAAERRLGKVFMALWTTAHA
jgi:hypothetical protein